MTFNDPEKEAFKNTKGKGENTGNQNFLVFLQSFRPIQGQLYVYTHTFDLLPLKSFKMDMSKTRNL